MSRDARVGEARATRAPVVHMSVVATAVGADAEQFVVRCLESLTETTAGAPFTVRVTVVDNSPGAGLAGRLRSRFPGVEIIENREPLGFAANHNAALADSRADYLLIANDDLVFRPGALARAVRFLEEPENRRVGVVAFKLLNPDGSLQPSTYSFPNLPTALISLSGLRELLPFATWTSGLARLLRRGSGRSRFWPHDRTIPVDTFRGALALVRADAAHDVGPMDEVSLLGGEEVEWHKRFWDGGWSVIFLHEATVIHHGSQTLKRVPGLRAEELKGLLNFFRKHRPGLPYLTLRILALPALLVRSIIAAASGSAGRGALIGVLWRTAWTWRGSRS